MVVFFQKSSDLIIHGDASIGAIFQKALKFSDDKIADALKTEPIIDEIRGIRRAAINYERKGLHELKSLIPKMVKITTGITLKRL